MIGMNRRMRKARAAKRRQDDAYQHFIKSLPKNVQDAVNDKDFDETKPLVFDVRGLTHKGCGGEVERSSYHGDSYCMKCQILIPSREVA